MTPNVKVHFVCPRISFMLLIIVLNQRTTLHEVNIVDLPQDVRQLYFVLSSWISPSIKHFVKPTFQLFDLERPTEQLCKYEIAKAGNSQAVVLAHHEGLEGYGGRTVVREK